jgi:hypothetical protein
MLRVRCTGARISHNPHAAAGAFAFLIASANARHRFAAPAGALIASGSPAEYWEPRHLLQDMLHDIRWSVKGSFGGPMAESTDE